MTSYLSKVALFPSPRVFGAPVWGVFVGISSRCLASES